MAVPSGPALEAAPLGRLDLADTTSIVWSSEGILDEMISEFERRQVARSPGPRNRTIARGGSGLLLFGVAKSCELAGVDG